MRSGSARLLVRKTDGTPTDEYMVQSFYTRADGERVWAVGDWQRYDEDKAASGYWIVTNGDTTIIRVTSLEGYDKPDPGYGETVTITLTLYSDYGVPYPTSINRTIRYYQTTDVDLRQYLLT